MMYQVRMAKVFNREPFGCVSLLGPAVSSLKHEPTHSRQEGKRQHNNPKLTLQAWCKQMASTWNQCNDLLCTAWTDMAARGATPPQVCQSCHLLPKLLQEQQRPRSYQRKPHSGTIKSDTSKRVAFVLYSSCVPQELWWCNIWATIELWCGSNLPHLGTGAESMHTQLTTTCKVGVMRE